jgi:regulatory protein
MKNYSTDELLNFAASLCAASERCTSEMLDKLKRRGAAPDVAQAIVDKLQKEHFIDELRYARAFVRDKYRFDRWGKQKIRMMLYTKSISPKNIDIALTEINREDYLTNLSDLLQNKQKNVKAKDDYERRAKIIRFALSKGYEMDDILFVLDK